jgi:hypothetical protein
VLFFKTGVFMEKKELSWAEIKEMFAETGRRIDKLGIEAERRAEEAERRAEEAERRAERRAKEDERRAREAECRARELDRMFAETDKRIDKLGTKVDGTNSRVDGIGGSNGKFAEEYFFSSLEEKKEFAGVHFDYVSNDFKGLVKMPDGNRVEDQFDIVMINDNAIAIIEIKYKANSDYLEELAIRKVNNFRILFPHYKDFNIYLGLGSFSFEKNVVEKAKEYGVGLLKQVGNTIEYKTNWEMKVY